MDIDGFTYQLYSSFIPSLLTLPYSHLNAKDSEGQAAQDGELVVSQQQSLTSRYCRASHPKAATRGRVSDSSPGVLMHCSLFCSYQGPLQKAKGERECIRADHSSR
ncbi:unnamed protein product [Leuciscus chuanchicus]